MGLAEAALELAVELGETAQYPTHSLLPQGPRDFVLGKLPG